MGASSVTGTGQGSAELPFRGLGDLKKALTTNGKPLVDGVFILNDELFPAGGSSLEVEVITAPTVTLTDTNNKVQLVNASNNNVTVILPEAANHSGLFFYIKKTDSSGNTVTIDANGSETIDGELNKIITTQYISIHIVCDGSNWHII